MYGNDSLLFYCFRVGDAFLLGAHDIGNCRESEGCIEVDVIQVWIHENHTIGERTYNDIAVVK